MVWRSYPRRILWSLGLAPDGQDPPGKTDNVLELTCSRLRGNCSTLVRAGELSLVVINGGGSVHAKAYSKVMGKWLADGWRLMRRSGDHMHWKVTPNTAAQKHIAKNL